MNCLDRHILFQLWTWMLVLMVAVCGLFAMVQFLKGAPLFMGRGLSPEDHIALAVGMQLPVLGYALLPVFGLALFATAMRMTRTGELLALDASGISRYRVMTIGWGALIPVVGASAVLWGWGIGQSGATIAEIVNRSGEQLLFGRLQAGMPIGDDRGFTFHAVEQNGEDFYQVFMEMDLHHRQWLLFAQRARLQRPSPGEPPGIQLTNGRLFLFESDTTANDGGSRRISVQFEELSISALPVMDSEILAKVVPLSLSYDMMELWRHRQMPTLRFELFRRMSKPLELLAIGGIMIALAFGVTRWRPWRGAAMSIALFVLSHTAGRIGEALVDKGVCAPLSGAMSALIVPGVALVIWYPMRKIQLGD